MSSPYLGVATLEFTVTINNLGNCPALGAIVGTGTLSWDGGNAYTGGIDGLSLALTEGDAPNLFRSFLGGNFDGYNLGSHQGYPWTWTVNSVICGVDVVASVSIERQRLVGAIGFVAPIAIERRQRQFLARRYVG